MTRLAEVPVRLAGTVGHHRLDGLIAACAPMLDGEEPVRLTVDLSDMSFCTPCGMATLRAAAHRAQARGLIAEGSSLRLPTGGCGDYLRRMDVFEGIVQFEAPEGFTRHRPHGFRPMMDVPDQESAESAAREITEAIGEGGALPTVARRTLVHSLGELADNVVGHAEGAVGMAVAQTYWQRNEVEVAIVDCGPGIPVSLRKNPLHVGLPRFCGHRRKGDDAPPRRSTWSNQPGGHGGSSPPSSRREPLS